MSGDDKNKDGKQNKENVIGFEKKRTEILKKKKADKARNQAAQNPAYYSYNPSNSTNPPMFNIPAGTKYLLGFLILIHIVIHYIANQDMQDWITYHLGFVPARFTSGNMGEALQFVTPITHMFLHGSWLHMGMNGVMLLAFGSGLEKWIGTKKMLQIFFVSGLIGIATHFAIYYYAMDPVIGASGGLSGMFAAALIMLQRQNAGMAGKYGIWPFIALWIGISVIFGLMGSPDGAAVAWVVHIGGFMGGFIAVKLLKI